MGASRAGPDQPVTALLEESAEDLYEHAPCGYLSTLPDGLIAKVNQTFLDWTGYRRDELVGERRFYELLTAGGRIYHETHYAPLLRMQGTVREIALDIVRTDGRRLPVLVNSVMKRDEAGEALFVRTTVFDASDRKEYERELLRARRRAEAADQAKAEFISTISHEIRTPLNAIMTVTHLFEAADLPPQQEKFVRILRSSSESLLGLINSVLDLSKIASGKVTVEAKPFDPREVIYGVAAGLEVKAEEKGVALEVALDDRLPPRLVGDPVKIGQVLTNLIGNAVKFTHEGAITVSLEVREATADAVQVEVRVSDTGIGIAPERLETIFEDFAQADYEVGRRYGGTGLGLAISKRLLGLMGSEITVESRAGEGSTFRFTLRLPVAAAEAAEAPAATSRERRRLAGLRVLVADDNEVNTYLLERLLDGWGVEHDVVHDGVAALERVRQERYDLVLMDLRMPELDGIDATRAIRRLPGEHFARLPILALSASMRLDDRDALETAGFSELVTKPIDPQVLFSKLARWAPTPDDR